MSHFHESIRTLLEDVHCFLVVSLQKEVLTSPASFHKENLIKNLENFHKEYPQLQLSLMSPSQSDLKNSPNVPEATQYSPSSPVPYVDMNGGSSYRIPSFGAIVEERGYDVCLREKRSSKESQSLTESEDTPEEGEKSYPDVAANDLYSCEKYGYLEKKKRDSLKGWLNPFQKRWCAIKDGRMYYFEKSSDKRQKGTIVLSGYEVRELPEANKDGKSHCFELVCPGRRTYQFSATSGKDLKQWIVSIEQSNKVAGAGMQDNSKQKMSYTSSDSLSYITEDIYECVEDVDDNTSPNSPQKPDSVIVQPTDDKPSSQKCNTDAEKEVPQSPIFNHRDWYVGLWDCWGSDDTELNFLRGDFIHVISKEYDSFAWWIGELQGKIGFVPKSYLMEAYEPC